MLRILGGPFFGKGHIKFVLHGLFQGPFEVQDVHEGSLFPILVSGYLKSCYQLLKGLRKCIKRFNYRTFYGLKIVLESIGMVFASKVIFSDGSIKPPPHIFKDFNEPMYEG